MPDASRHKICRRCQKWFEPDEGVLDYLESSGPFSAMRAASARIAGNESAKRFTCHRCLKIRRITKYVVFGAFVALVITVLILERLGAI
jgi:hypothetical protein